MNLNSKDLNSLDYLQKDLQYYKESEKAKQARDEADNSHTEIIGKKPELFTKIFTLKLKSSAEEIVQSQLDKKLKILVSVGKC